MQELSLLQLIAVWALPVLFAITVHEVAHGWMAMKLGDSTAKMLGRLTLNPIKHIDPIGTLLVPGIMIISSYLSHGSIFLFGWAKPVPVTWENLKKPKRDMALVAIAGPGANLLMGFIWLGVVIASLTLHDTSPWLAKPLFLMGGAGISINVLLMVLNLLPILPLDGGRIVSSLLPKDLSWKFSRLENYGLIILLTLLLTGILGKIIGPIVGSIQELFLVLAGLKI